jgi:hypothetical protein
MLPMKEFYKTFSNKFAFQTYETFCSATGLCGKR